MKKELSQNVSLAKCVPLAKARRLLASQYE